MLIKEAIVLLDGDTHPWPENNLPFPYLQHTIESIRSLGSIGAYIKPRSFLTSIVYKEGGDRQIYNADEDDNSWGSTIYH